MKPIELHLYLPFSYWLARDPETGAPLRKPDARAVAQALQALCAELDSMKEDYADCEVTAIRVIGGYLSLLDAEELSRLLLRVRRAFRVQKDCPVCGPMFPGQLDMQMIALYRDAHVSPLLFELPSLSFRECERLGFPVALQALDKTAYFLGNFGEEEWGLRLPVGIAGRTESYWVFVRGQLFHYRPKYLQFFSLAPGLDEGPGFARLCEELQRSGYRRAAGNSFALSESVPLLLLEPGKGSEYVGAGLGARSLIDGYRVQSTADPARYFQNCRDCRSLIEHVESAE